MNPNAVDGQWLDFYALLDVPVNADEDTIRKRIGKVYAEAAANSDHRDLTKRHYFQALVERVLPQCRRVLLDPEWRAKYDRQHILHTHGDPSAQDYVAFIASVRGGIVPNDEATIPTRIQEEIKLAQQVVETIQTGEQMELIPAKAISSKPEVAAEPIAEAAPPIPEKRAPKPEVKEDTGFAQAVTPVSKAKAPAERTEGRKKINAEELEAELNATPTEDNAVRAKVITAQEAADIRRRRHSNVDAQVVIAPSMHMDDDGTGIVIPPRHKKGAPVSRVVVGDQVRRGAKKPKLISSTSLNLMVAITGVLLTITIQKMTLVQPAVAGNADRTPVFVAVSSSLEPVMEKAEPLWEKSREGAKFDLVLQPVDARSGMRRALGLDGNMPDAWIPSDSLWSERYNEVAAQYKRRFITAESPLAQTPIVLIARDDHAQTLKSRFPNHTIPTWSALRDAVMSDAAGHFGMTAPDKSGAGAISRFSMASEWARSQGMSTRAAATNKDLWKWMAGFEDSSPDAPALTSDMVKDLVLGTTGRYWWGIAYESDALGWMAQGKPLEIFYLPRTFYADHPYCHIERLGASSDAMQARSNFEKFMRSPAMQKALLTSGFRPTEIEITTKVEGNPFLNADFRKRGARATNLPRQERLDYTALNEVTSEWKKRYG
jgi:hypothetical protein